MYALGSLAFVFLNHNVVAPTAGSFIRRSEMMKCGWYADHKFEAGCHLFEETGCEQIFLVAFFLQRTWLSNSRMTSKRKTSRTAGAPEMCSCFKLSLQNKNRMRLHYLT